VQERDKKLLENLRKVVTRSTKFIERAESGEVRELASADGLGVLSRTYGDASEEMSGRAAALYATHPWPVPELRDPLKAPCTD
jgi:hypothetical protein